MKSLAGYTEPGGTFPQYVSFALDGDEVVVIVREPEFQGGEHNHVMNGNTASARMPVGEFWCLWRRAMRELGKLVPAVEQK